MIFYCSLLSKAAGGFSTGHGAQNLISIALQAYHQHKGYVMFLRQLDLLKVSRLVTQQVRCSRVRTLVLILLPVAEASYAPCEFLQRYDVTPAQWNVRYCVGAGSLPQPLRRLPVFILDRSGHLCAGPGLLGSSETLGALSPLVSFPFEFICPVLMLAFKEGGGTFGWSHAIFPLSKTPHLWPPGAARSRPGPPGAARSRPEGFQGP